MKSKYSRALATLATATLVSTSLLSTVQQATAQDQAAEAAASTKLAVGDNAPTIEGLTWLKGDQIANLNEPGKVYMLELWATWCGPCVAIIPHVNDLHKKYADKGLVVVGVNVFEDDIEAPKAFVEKQGDAMSYRVAFSGGQDGAFTKNWIAPANIQGIPHAIFIRDGKILFMGHPNSIQESTIEAMLDGKYDAAAEAAKIAAAEKAEAELREKVLPLMQSGDWDGVLAVAESLEETNPAKLQLQLTAIFQKGDWKALTEARANIATKTGLPVTPADLDQNAAISMKTGDGSKEYATAALQSLTPLAADAEAPVVAQRKLIEARLQFLAGNTDAAKAALDAVAPALEKIEHPQMKEQLEVLLPAAQKHLAEGSFPSYAEIGQAAQQQPAE